MGFDYRWTDVATISTNSVIVDTVDVLQPISNILPDVTLKDGDPTTSQTYSYGLLLQEVMTFNRYLKLSLGLRYSQVNGLSDNVVSSTGGDVWDPLFGIIITPIENINFLHRTPLPLRCVELPTCWRTVLLPSVPHVRSRWRPV